jgi:hypothetical protein
MDLSSLSHLLQDTLTRPAAFLFNRERETEQAQQLARLVVGLGGGGYDDVHAAHLIDLVVADLREDDLLLQPIA